MKTSGRLSATLQAEIIIRHPRRLEICTSFLRISILLQPAHLLHTITPRTFRCTRVL